MGASDLLERLRTAGVRVSVEGDALIAEPRTALTDDLRAAIRAHKPELLAALTHHHQGGSKAVIRLRLLLEGEDGQRLEAILAIPGERYDGLRVLELFEQHRLAGTTRVVGISGVEPDAAQEGSH